MDSQRLKNNTVYISKFYGSCGHIETEKIPKEKFDELAKETIVKTIFGDFPHKNEVTEENGDYIVHIHPFRFCVCSKCMKEETHCIKWKMHNTGSVLTWFNMAKL